MSVEWIDSAFRDRALPFGLRTRCTGAHSTPFTQWRSAVRTIDRWLSPAHGASSGTSMISDCRTQAWFTPWGTQAEFDRVNKLPRELHQSAFHCWSRCFCQGCPCSPQQSSSDANTLIPPRLRGIRCTASTLIKRVGFIQIAKTLPSTVQGDLVPHGLNRAVQSGHKRDSEVTHFKICPCRWTPLCQAPISSWFKTDGIHLNF